MANGEIPILANLDLNYNEIRKMLLQKLATDPTGESLKEARCWYDSVNHCFKFFDGTSVVAIGNNMFILATEKGAAGGVATLDGAGKIPAGQLPSYVDDVVEAYIVSGASAFSAGWLSLTAGGAALTPEKGKIYAVLSTGEYYNRTYRWGGSEYIEIAASIIYTAGNGINIDSDNIIALKLDSGNANGLSLTVSGLKLALASSNGAGAMSASDKSKLDGIATGATKTEASSTNGNVKVDGLEVQVYRMQRQNFNNPALTVSGGICTWPITHNFGLKDVIVVVRSAASPYSEVVVDVEKTSDSVCTVKIVSDADIAASTYVATVIGA